MKNQGLFDLFVEELADMFSAENQIIDALPKLIKAASSPELKEALTNHLEETKNQVRRIEKIFKMIDMPASKKFCKGMEGILAEGEEMIRNKVKSPTLDAAIICSAQKVEHYEIASYGTMRSFASNLNLGSDITSLLQESLDEEGTANKKLTKIADGGFFTEGVNQEAVATSNVNSRKNK